MREKRRSKSKRCSPPTQHCFFECVLYIFFRKSDKYWVSPWFAVTRLRILYIVRVDKSLSQLCFAVHSSIKSLTSKH
jgi:hypothetical protein